MKRALVLLADGCEEVEAVTPIDMLRRVGVDVDTASISGSHDVISSHNIPIKADILLRDADLSGYDAIVLPGGGVGTDNLKASPEVKSAVLTLMSAGKLVAAICAAPTALGLFGVLNGRHACCYPGMEDQLTGAEVSYDSVTVDGNIITSRGAGSAMLFSFALCEYLTDLDTVSNLREKIVYSY